MMLAPKNSNTTPMTMAATNRAAKEPRRQGLDKFATASTRSELASAVIVFETPWLKVAFSRKQPRMTFLSVDALGYGNHSRNLLKDCGAGPMACLEQAPIEDALQDCDVSVDRNSVHYSAFPVNDTEKVSICFTIHPESIGVSIDRACQHELADASLFRFIFDATVTPVSPLGRLKEGEAGTLQFPLLLHFPDWGSLLVRTKKNGRDEPFWKFSLLRDLSPIQLGAVAAWRAMTPEERERVEKIGNRHLLQLNPKGDADPAGEGALHIGPEEIQLDLQTVRPLVGKHHINFEMTVTAIYPEAALVDADPALVGIKKAWLNIFGFRADLGCLANNSTGDTCQFCIYCYADQAAETPPLFDDFTALDLVRVSLDRYFDGFKGYSDHFQDVAPSTVIAAWTYATRKPDREWLRKNIDNIEAFADRIVAQDIDGDGFCESSVGPTNWWDNIKWNGKDSYSSALAWRAFRCIADLERTLDRETQAGFYSSRATLIKSSYYATFYNPQTGVLAGWRTLDGELRDSYFLWANGIAISYGLVEKLHANAILDRLQAKIKEAGFESFQFGLPGNLEAFPHHLTFQLYENGGVTGSMAYHYIQALYTMNRQTEADAIFYKMMEGYRNGTFQNGIGNGGDWKEWNGTPCGYEGMLVDAYYPLTAWITGKLHRGLFIP